MNSEDLKLIIFDMDGVILDSEPLHENARQIMYQKYGIVPGEGLPNPVGKSSSGYWRVMSQEYKLDCNPYEMEAEQYHLVAQQIEEKQILPSEGLLDVIEWARVKGYKVGLASSSTRMLVDDTLRLLGLTAYFDYTVSGNEVKKKKPSPDVYLQILGHAGISPAEAVAIEDSGVGVEAAIKAGIYCFGYANETSIGQDISHGNKRITKLTEIMDELE